MASDCPTVREIADEHRTCDLMRRLNQAKERAIAMQARWKDLAQQLGLIKGQQDSLLGQFSDCQQQRDRLLSEQSRLATESQQLQIALAHVFPYRLYKEKRPDLRQLGDDELIAHFLSRGVNEKVELRHESHPHLIGESEDAHIEIEKRLETRGTANSSRTERVKELELKLHSATEKISLLQARLQLLFEERDKLTEKLIKSGQYLTSEYGTAPGKPDQEISSPASRDGLAVIHQRSSFVSDKWQSYFSHYDRNFCGLRDRREEVSILEIGVQNGGSLEAWSEYFGSNARVVGADINPASGLLDFKGKAECLVGDATDPEWTAWLCSSRGPFDIIIDDGSHRNLDIVKTFFLVYPSIRPGGIYVCEDLHTAYMHSYGGSPPQRGENAIELFKEIADLVNLEHWGGASDLLLAEHLPLLSREMTASNTFTFLDLLAIESVEFCNSMVFIRKTLAGPCSLGPRVVSGATADVEGEVKRFNATRMGL